MSLGSNIGAEIAAEDILKKVDEVIEKYRCNSIVDPKAVEALNEVRQRAESIRESAAAGWY